MVAVVSETEAAGELEKAKCTLLQISKSFIAVMSSLPFLAVMDCNHNNNNSNNNNSSPKSFAKSMSLPPLQRMELSAFCAICAMPTADESDHSTAVTLHPYRSATCLLYIRLTVLL